MGYTVTFMGQSTDVILVAAVLVFGFIMYGIVSHVYGILRTDHTKYRVMTPTEEYAFEMEAIRTEKVENTSGN